MDWGVLRTSLGHPQPHSIAGREGSELCVCVSLDREEIKDSSRDGKDMHLLSCHFIPGERSDTRRPSFKTPGPASGTSDSDLHLFHECQRQATMPKSL